MVFRPLLWPTLTALPIFCIALTLGVWQLERLEWKRDLIARMTERRDAPVQLIDDVVARAVKPNDVDYWAAKATGTFDHSHELHLYAIDADGAPGYRILTPLLRPWEPTLFVDRGFVPEDLKDPATRRAGQITDEVTVEGVAREAGRKGFFQPDNQPTDNLWFYVDLDAMAAAAGIGNHLPIYLQAGASPVPGGWPKGSPPNVNLPNNHLNYALTWFGVAVALAVIYLVYHANAHRLVLPIVRLRSGR